MRASRGQGAHDTLRVYSRARELFSDQTTVKDEIAILFGLSSFQFIRAEHLAATQVAHQMLELAARHADREVSAFADRMMGLTSWVAGMFERAECHLERVIAPFRSGEVGASDLNYSAEHLVWALSVLAMVLYPLGYLERSAITSKLAMDLAHPTGHAMTIGFAYMWRLALNRLFPIQEQNLELAHDAFAYCNEQKLRGFIPAAQFYKGLALVRQGEARRGIGLMHEGIQATEEINFRFLLPTFFGQLASVQAELGEFDLALDSFNVAIQTAEKTRELHFVAELYRLRGKLRLERGEDEIGIGDLEQSLSISSAQHSRTWHLRAATLLAEYRAHRGMRSAARDLLAPALGWFKETNFTVDLDRANALLNKMCL
jgi:tetratricopeptide (TPR) repeat protein